MKKSMRLFNFLVLVCLQAAVVVVGPVEMLKRLILLVAISKNYLSRVVDNLRQISLIRTDSVGKFG